MQNIKLYQHFLYAESFTGTNLKQIRFTKLSEQQVNVSFVS